ncbi:Response regulator receiver domain-containing protein [Hymenobacter gelipurpurascens]|uniref:Response regulator receiver domain-containing protein n=1 Tax=Hymenobacter gelipurpurascens TaxID=89968 RepID=A0A212T3U5_9BACT|nr:response regulator [Hymenobacter gelipurpurascens]SNC60511.1 Response regulator receiver domain-containing protein [Hymenobacter gelipurpurascens]
MHTVLIDDDSTSIFLMKLLLERENFSETITAFQSAQEALEYLQNALPDQLPHVILLDLNMPVMNGWQFLDALRPEAPELLGNCRIYILTSSLAHTDRARAEQNPLVTRLIHKPLDRKQLDGIREDARAL